MYSQFRCLCNGLDNYRDHVSHVICGECDTHYKYEYAHYHGRMFIYAKNSDGKWIKSKKAKIFKDRVYI